MRAIFFGSPAFAVPCLEALNRIADIVAVISQPDRPAGRGLSLRAPAVKTRALELGLAVSQPRKVRTAAFAGELRDLEADVGVVVAYGRILPKAVLDAPKAGCVNVHASLLPRWRGAAPIQWSIVHGDETTGVTLMQMDEGMDTGPILAAESTAVGKRETAGALSGRLATMGAELLERQLPRVVARELEPRPQDDALATLAPLLKKTDGQIDWSRSAREIDRHIRGMTPWPGAYTHAGDRRLRVLRAHPLTLDPEGKDPGTVVVLDKEGILVACAQGVLAIDELQESGRKPLTAERFAAGRGLSLGDILGNEEQA